MKPRRERKVYYLSYGIDRSTVTYPMIRLAGKFLHELGFQVGDDIEVVYEPGKITITKQSELPFPEPQQSNPGSQGRGTAVAAEFPAESRRW